MDTQATISPHKEEIVKGLRETYARLKAEGKIAAKEEILPEPPAAVAPSAPAEVVPPFDVSGLTLEDIRAGIVSAKEQVGFQRYMQALTSSEANDQEYIAALNDLSSVKPTDALQDIQAKYARFVTAADVISHAAPPASSIISEREMKRAAARALEKDTAVPVPSAAPLSSSSATPVRPVLVLDANGNIDNPANSAVGADATKVVLFNESKPKEDADVPVDLTPIAAPPAAAIVDTSSAPIESEPSGFAKVMEEMPVAPLTPEAPASIVMPEQIPPIVQEQSTEPLIPPIAPAPAIPSVPMRSGPDSYREPIDDVPQSPMPVAPLAPRPSGPDSYRELIDDVVADEPLPQELKEIPLTPPEPELPPQVGFAVPEQLMPPEQAAAPVYAPLPSADSEVPQQAPAAQMPAGVLPAEVGGSADPLMYAEVTGGLEQLLSEWDIFASSGVFGFGSGGIEHPTYKKLSKLHVAAILAGRWEGSNEKVVGNIKMYMDGWRSERGVEALPEETFENYLRRVVSRILAG